MRIRQCGDTAGGHPMPYQVACVECGRQSYIGALWARTGDVIHPAGWRVDHRDDTATCDLCLARASVADVDNGATRQEYTR